MSTTTDETPTSAATTAVSRHHYRKEYTPQFVDRWDEYIDWKARREAEGGFFQKLLEENGCRKVLDIACGTGFHTVTLNMDGFDVTGADGAATMLEKARENAQRIGQQDIRFLQAEWTSLTNTFPDERFDAVLCLGNAFTHLFEEKDRIQALKEIHAVLGDDGIAIIDHRNYDMILDKGYRSKHEVYYLGDTVEADVEELSPKLVKFRYEYEDGEVHHLTLCPIRQEYITRLMKEAGFRGVERHGDFERPYDFYEPDSIIQVAKKRP
jgi:ubiquinone/menaquinone biosynthesis C-methylase UbiE